MPKHTESAETEEKGLIHLRRIVVDMHFVFREFQRPDLGLDALIELKIGDSPTAQFILVQSKSGRSYMRNLNADTFDFYSDPSHLVYWQDSSNPVIVVIHDPQTQTSWWKHVQHYVHHHPEIIKRPPRKIRYHKRKDCFTSDCAAKLQRMMKLRLDRQARRPTRFEQLVRHKAIGSINPREVRQLNKLISERRQLNRSATGVQSQRKKKERMLKEKMINAILDYANFNENGHETR